MEPISNYFNTVRPQYLTLSRKDLEGMPESWQARFVECLVELDEALKKGQKQKQKKAPKKAPAGKQYKPGSVHDPSSPLYQYFHDSKFDS